MEMKGEIIVMYRVMQEEEERKGAVSDAEENA